jgi:hypothetical protein
LTLLPTGWYHLVQMPFLERLTRDEGARNWPARQEGIMQNVHSGYTGGTPEGSMAKKTPRVPPLRANRQYAEHLWKLAEDLGVLGDLDRATRKNYRNKVMEQYPDQVRALHARVMFRKPDTPPPFLRIRSEAEGRMFWLLRLAEAKFPLIWEGILKRLEQLLEPEIQRIEAAKVLAQIIPLDENTVSKVTGMEEEDDAAWIRSWAEALRSKE